MKLLPVVDKKPKKEVKDLDKIALVIKQKSIANYTNRRRNITVYANIN